MKILHLITLDIGGASAARRLHQAFLDYGHESVIVVQKKYSSDADVIQYKSFLILQKIWDRLIDSIIRWKPDYYFFNTCEFISFSNAKGILSLVPFNPDVIILHWVSRFINMKIVHELQKRTRAKIIWNMLDMAPMTGGCHYAWQCLGYQKGCGNCPAVHSRSDTDLSSINFSVKQKYLQIIRPIVIAPSTELYAQAKKSLLFRNNPIHKILLPIDLKKFYPGHKNKLRKKYQIPFSRKVICFRSDIPNQKRKGFEYIVKCFDLLYKRGVKNMHLAIIGKISGDDKKRLIFPYTLFSSPENDIELGDIYRLSDVFLCASIQDSGPMMINETIASGLPVISFPVGVTKDLIIEGKTGSIARMKDPIDLANKIYAFFSMKPYDYKKMSKYCRKLAAEKLSFHVVAKQYEKII